jgi:hypothetical protein
MIEENAGPETPDVRTPPESAAASAPALEAVRQLLPFHRQITDYLKTEEPEQWQWFSSTEYLDEHAKAARLELLKSCYRFSPEEHADLYARVERARSGLGLTVPVTVYQSQSAKAMNAFLSYVPGEVHVVLEGPIRSTLSDDELCATLAHELAHFYLWEAADRELLVAEQIQSVPRGARRQGRPGGHAGSPGFHLVADKGPDGTGGRQGRELSPPVRGDLRSGGCEDRGADTPALGQIKRKGFPTSERARAEAEKLIREKLGKGYSEVEG